METLIENQSQDDKGRLGEKKASSGIILWGENGCECVNTQCQTVVRWQRLLEFQLVIRTAALWTLNTVGLSEQCWLHMRMIGRRMKQNMNTELSLDEAQTKPWLTATGWLTLRQLHGPQREEEVSQVVDDYLNTEHKTFSNYSKKSILHIYVQGDCWKRKCVCISPTDNWEINADLSPRTPTPPTTTTTPQLLSPPSFPSPLFTPAASWKKSLCCSADLLSAANRFVWLHCWTRVSFSWFPLGPRRGGQICLQMVCCSSNLRETGPLGRKKASEKTLHVI